jgi:serine/threonine-protein kinase
MGHVWLARDERNGLDVALKMIVREGKVAERAEREARAAASLRHPRCQRIYALARDPSHIYIAYEYVPGRTMRQALAAGELDDGEAVEAAAQLLDALAHAHAKGIVHRDVKPSNIIVLRDRDGREHVKLVDFGIAKIADPAVEKLTGVGAVIGTPAYMSPEQLLALDDVDHTSDIYAVGVTMFECLSGTMPYAGNYPQVLLGATGDQPPPSVRSVSAEVPLALVLVVDRAIAKARTDRFSSMQDFAGAIRAAVPDANRGTTLLGPPPLPRAELRVEEQRRRAKRAPYNTPVQLVLAGSQNRTIDGRSEDISEGGILFLSHADCPTDQRVSARFALPMEGKVISVEAQARWIRAAPGHALGIRAMGLEFVDLPPAVRSSIAQYVGLMADRNQA